MTCSCHPDVATQARADAQRDIHRDEACELRHEIRGLREQIALLEARNRELAFEAGNWEREAKARGAVDWRTPR